MTRPDKLNHLLRLIRQRVQSGDYLLTYHAQQRQADRGISRPDIEYVLSYGWHEKRKDKFDMTHQAWNYAIRGHIFGDESELRIIVSFDDDMLIITVINLNQ